MSSSSSSTSSSSSSSSSVVLIAPLDSGMPGPEHFRIETHDIHTTLAPNQILIKVLAMSADPYLRGSIKKNGSNGKAGSVIRGFVAGKILSSTLEGWVAGDFIGASLPFTTLQKVSGADLATTVSWKLTGYVTEDTISLGVGVLGMPGSTAYGGYLDILKPNEGETVFVSAASGAVGSLVGQLAKQLHKCKVIGSCGGPDKVKLVKEKFGFDDAIDYKQVKDAAALTAVLKEKTGDQGIDMYFENVGGMHWDAALSTLRPHGRVAICGGISEYNNPEQTPQQIYPMKLVYTFQRIEGFMCMPWLTGKRGNFLPDMAKWLKEGKLKAEETFFDGIDSWPLALQSLFTGKSVGKVVVRTL